MLLGTPWGFVLLPVLAVIFHGAIGREWNRFMVAAALAAIPGTAFILAWPDWSTPRLPYPLALLALGLARHLYLRLRHHPARTPTRKIMRFFKTLNCILRYCICQLMAFPFLDHSRRASLPCRPGCRICFQTGNLSRLLILLATGMRKD